MKIFQAVKKLNSISRARLNFRRGPVLCTTLYRNLTTASNCGGTVDQLFHFFLKFSQKMPLYFFDTMVQKSQKWPKTQIKGGPVWKRDVLGISAYQWSERATFRESSIVRSWKLQNVTALQCIQTLTKPMVFSAQTHACTHTHTYARTHTHTHTQRHGPADRSWSVS